MVKEFLQVDEEGLTAHRTERAADYAIAASVDEYLKVNTAGRIESRLSADSIFTKDPVVKVI